MEENKDYNKVDLNLKEALEYKEGKQRLLKRRLIFWSITFILIALIITISYFFVKNRSYALLYISMVIACCIPFYVNFERKTSHAREIIVIAVMTTIAVVGRLIFAPIPGFKPVTAIVIITGIAFGAESGFITGSLTAVISNMFYGQGPWTPFQMLSWGLIGFIAGLCFYNKKKIKVIFLVLIGLVSGAAYSLMMDFFSTLIYDGGFKISRYIALIISSLPTMAEYVVSDIVFLVILTKPLLLKLNRVKVKYNVFNNLK